MQLFNKHYFIPCFLYALYSICNLHIANCEGLTDVCTQDLSKIDKTLGWSLILGTTLFCGFLIYKGIYPSDSTETVSALPPEGILALDSKIIDKPQQNKTDLTLLKDSQYLKFLQELTKYNN